MKKKKVASTLIIIILFAFVSVTFSNQQKDFLYTAIALSPALEPTPSATLTPPKPTISFTLWHTNSSVIQQPTNELDHMPPICEIVSPENQTKLPTNNFTLNVNVASYFWVINSVYYNADWVEGIHQIFGIQPNGIDAYNASITVNLSEIPDGNHTVTVYANTHDNSHSFATAIFSTEMYQPNLTNPESFPTLPVIVAVSTIAIVVGLGIGLLFFRKHRKINNLDQ